MGYEWLYTASVDPKEGVRPPPYGDSTTILAHTCDECSKVEFGRNSNYGDYSRPGWEWYEERLTCKSCLDKYFIGPPHHAELDRRPSRLSVSRAGAKIYIPNGTLPDIDVRTGQPIESTLSHYAVVDVDACTIAVTANPNDVCICPLIRADATVIEAIRAAVDAFSEGGVLTAFEIAARTVAETLRTNATEIELLTQQRQKA